MQAAAVLLITVSALGQHAGHDRYPAPLSPSTAARESRFANTPLVPIPNPTPSTQPSGFDAGRPRQPIPARLMDAAGRGVQHAKFGNSDRGQNRVEPAQFDSLQPGSAANAGLTDPRRAPAETSGMGTPRERSRASMPPTYLRPQADDRAGNDPDKRDVETRSPQANPPAPLTPIYQAPRGGDVPDDPPAQKMAPAAMPNRGSNYPPPARGSNYPPPAAARPPRVQDFPDEPREVTLPQIGSNRLSTPADRNASGPVPDRAIPGPQPPNSGVISPSPYSNTFPTAGTNQPAVPAPPAVAKSPYSESGLAAGNAGPDSETTPPPTYGRNNANGELLARSGNSYFMTLLALFASVGLNLYLGWIAWDTYNRYQDLVADMRYTGSRRPRGNEDPEYSDHQLARSGAY